MYCLHHNSWDSDSNLGPGNACCTSSEKCLYDFSAKATKCKIPFTCGIDGTPCGRSTIMGYQSDNNTCCNSNETCELSGSSGGTGYSCVPKLPEGEVDTPPCAGGAFRRCGGT